MRPAAPATARSVRWALAGAGVLVAGTLARATLGVPRHAYLTNVSGVWIAHALDLVDGVFYRPLAGPDGYGGTRYFPLHFVVHAAVARATGLVIPAGHAVGILSMGALLGGVYALLRRQAAPHAVSLLGALLVLAPETSQYALMTIRGDGLPAALNVWGLVLGANALASARERVLPAAVLFTLTFAAKGTSVFGLVATVAALFVARRPRAAARLCGLTLAGILLVCVGVHLSSEGRAVEVFSACALIGFTPVSLLLSPRHLLLTAGILDPILLAFFGLCAAVLIEGRRRSPELPALALLATAMLTTPMFASSGISSNHLLDLHVAAVVYLGARVAKGDGRSALLAGVLGALALIGGALALYRAPLDPRVLDREETAQMVRLTPATAGPVLSDDPLIPVLAGRRPHLLDQFMFNSCVAGVRPQARAQLFERLDRGWFPLVILSFDPATQVGQDWFVSRFGEGSLEHFRAGYTQAMRIGRYGIFAPR